MSTVTWGSVFNSNTSAFQVPQAVLTVTGGTKNGNATVTEPSTGWTDSGLKTVFGTTRKSGEVTPSPSPTSTPATDKKGTNVGAVAGGVVAGVVAVALISGILFFLRRRHNKKRAPSELHSDELRPGELGTEKDQKFELQAVNDNNPAELPGPEAQELNAPREFVEADSNNTATHAAELSGTSIAQGGNAGVPHVRTPGDDLPETPFYTPGLRRQSSIGFTAPQETTETTQQPTSNPTAPPKGISKHDPN